VIRSAAWLALACAVACSAPEGSAADRPIVAVSVPPQAWFVERLAGELVQVEVMLPPGANPSTHNPSMAQLKAATRARLYVKVGHPAWPFEQTWLARLLAEGPELTVVDGARGPACGGEDPHIWLSPACMRTLGDDLAAALAELLPEHRERIVLALDALHRELDELDAELRRTLAGVQGRTLLVQHPSWGSFARDYGLVQLSIESERKEPSAAELAEVLATARSRGVRHVFVQPQFAPLAAETVAAELGAQLEVLDPLSRDWATNLRSAARVFAERLVECSPPRQELPDRRHAGQRVMEVVDCP
jgi:zinc transport system substrate-binding protein